MAAYSTQNAQHRPCSRHTTKSYYVCSRQANKNMSLKRRLMLYYVPVSRTSITSIRIVVRQHVSQVRHVHTVKVHLAKVCQHGKMLRDQIPNDSGSHLSTTLLDSCNARCNPGVLPLRKIGRASKLVKTAFGTVGDATLCWHDRTLNTTTNRFAEFRVTHTYIFVRNTSGQYITVGGPI